MSVFAIFNPAAGRGRGARRAEHYLALLRREIPELEHAFTQTPGDEAALVEQAVAGGHDSIVAVGGDGTWSLVADHILRTGRNVTLGLLPAGTGNDFGKSLGATHARAEQIVRGIATGRRRRIDVGRVNERHFLNVVGMGFDIAVIDDAARVPLLKGDLLYQFCALRQLFRFPGLPLEVSTEGRAAAKVDHLMLVVANASYFGGSFHIAPHASLEDGKLDAVSIADADPLSRARLFARVAKGQHEGHAKVTVSQGRSFRIAFEAPIRYEMDGEVYSSQADSLTIEAVPQALDVFVPAE
jgi:diacylglycerol kinase (ATP)